MTMDAFGSSVRVFAARLQGVGEPLWLLPACGAIFLAPQAIARTSGRIVID